MTKGKAKINSNEDTAPAQTRSLRSRRRASCSAEESSQTHDIQAAPLRKATERDMKAAENTLLQSNLKEGAEVTNIHHEGEEQSSLSKPDDSNFENNSEETDATGMGKKAEEETTVCDPDHRFELESCGEQADDCPNGNETGSKESRRSPSKPQMFVATSEDDRESCHAVLEKQVVEKERSNSKRNPDTNSPSDVKEPAVGLPAKKKRRMGMCGLTEKERSHFLQAQQRDTAQNGAKSSEKQALEEDVSPSHSTPPHITTEVLEDREEEAQPAHSGNDHRAETEAYDVVTGSDGTSNQGCLEERNPEAKGDSMSDPEPNGNTDTIEPAKEEKHPENLQPPEVKEPTSGNMSLVAEIQIKTEEDFSSKVQTKEESDTEAARPERRCVNGGKLEMTVVICGDGDEGASSRGTEGFSCVSENLCEVPLTPTVQEMNNSCDSNGDPVAGSSTVRTEHAPTRDLGGSLGTGCLDYVSDSQLNTIVLTEEREEELEPSGNIEDATELICGLIRELSSLNRKVMVAHRELENLRRKPSRSSVR